MQTQLKTYGDEYMAEAVKCYSFKFAENQFGVLEEIGDALDHLDDNLEQDDGTPSDAIHQQALRYQFDHPDASYPDAVEKIMAMNPDLSRSYAGECAGRPARKYQQAGSNGDPAQTIHDKALVYMDETGEEDYAVAVDHVMDADRQLSEAYHEFVSA